MADETSVNATETVAATTPQTDPAELAAEAVRRQMSGYIANLQAQLGDVHTRLEQRELAELDENGQAQYLLNKERQRAAMLEQQLQQVALQQQKAADVQRLSAMFAAIGVEVTPQELMDAPDVMSAVERAANKARQRIPAQVAQQAQQIAERDTANAVHLGGGRQTPDAQQELEAAKTAGDPVAALRAIYRMG